MPEKSKNDGTRIIISGGGSGGHVFPAIAIADAIKDKRPDADILFVGAKDKIEMEKVPKAGYPIRGLWISGFHRQLTLRNLLFPFKLVSSLFTAALILRKFRPQVVVGVGGFASGPVLEVATRTGIPTLIQEQNSYAGITNRLLARKVDRICVAYEDMDRYFPAESLVMTGNPVRQDLAAPERKREEAYRFFGLDTDKPVLAVFGGSLGAQSINEALAANAELLGQHPEVQLLWQCGSLYYERFSEKAVARLPNVHIQAFVDRMDLAYLIADVVICRAGALTISELSLLGKAAILIPSPNVAEDHQTPNAKALAEQQAAVLVPDKEAPERIIREALELLDKPELLKELRKNIKLLARPEAAAAIADEVLKLAQRNEA